MNERIKELRKELGLTLEQFGKRIGVTKVAISNIEKGKRNVTEQMFKSVCREFNVNEEWLRNGSGDMFNEPSYFNLDEFLAEKGASELEVELTKAYFSIDPEIRHSMLKTFKKLIAYDEKKRLSQADDNIANAPTKTNNAILTDDEIDKEVAGYRQQLEAQKKAADESSAMNGGLGIG